MMKSSGQNILILYEIDYLGSINMGSGKHANFLVLSSSELYKRGKPLESWGRKRCKETKRNFVSFFGLC